MSKDNPEQTCCPEFQPSSYDGKEFIWKNKLFLKDTVRQLFHIPLNFGQVVTRMWKQVDLAKASPENRDFLLLAYDPSPWKSELYMTVTKEIPGGQMARLSGTYMTKVFDGPYNAVPHWLKEMEIYLKARKKTMKKPYIFYTYCPKCAKKYGHNYGVVFAEV